MNHLADKQCQPCKGNTPPLSVTQQKAYLGLCPGWNISKDNKQIERCVQFKGFYSTMSFVNAVAWIANQQGHHPTMQVSYQACQIVFTTHAIDGLTENDFICAAKVNQLLLDQ